MAPMASCLMLVKWRFATVSHEADEIAGEILRNKSAVQLDREPGAKRYKLAEVVIPNVQVPKQEQPAACNELVMDLSKGRTQSRQCTLRSGKLPWLVPSGPYTKRRTTKLVKFDGRKSSEPALIRAQIRSRPDRRPDDRR